MTKRIGFSLFAAVFAGVLALQAAGQKDIHTQKDEKDVLQVESQWARALQSGDMAGLESVLASDYRAVDHTGKSHNKASEIAMYRGEVKLQSFRTGAPQVKIYIGGAIVTGTATVKGKHKAEDISGDYIFVHVYESRKGGWQPVFSQSTKVETEKDKKKVAAKK